MVESSTLALLLGLMALTAAIGLALIRLTSRIMMLPSLPAATTDPVLRAKDQTVIHDPRSPFILMPDHLKTNDEMVTWMTRELPRLTAERHQRRV